MSTQEEKAKVQVVLSQEDFSHLSAQSKEMGISLSAYLRLLLKKDKIQHLLRDQNATPKDVAKAVFGEPEDA